MASAKGGGMKPDSGWQPGCQPSVNPPGPNAVATWLPVPAPAPGGSAEAGLISNGNQVATQEGR